MGQNNSNEKANMLALIENINKVEGFDPTPFAVDFIDLNTNEVRKRLPVMIQMAWFRLKYPEGRIAVHVEPGTDCFVATARIYPSYKDGADCYLAEATASRGLCPEKPSVSPREWAQTAAVGIALRNAGFGLQFAMAGEDFEEIAPDEFGSENTSVTSAKNTGASESGDSSNEPYTVVTTPTAELSAEDKINKAMATPCPISKYAGKTLGEVLCLDAGAINWVAEKFQGNPEISEAAKLIREYALQQESA